MLVLFIRHIQGQTVKLPRVHFLGDPPHNVRTDGQILGDEQISQTASHNIKEMEAGGSYSVECHGSCPTPSYIPSEFEHDPTCVSSAPQCTQVTPDAAPLGWPPLDWPHHSS